MTGQRTARPCRGCGIPTQARGYLCRPCNPRRPKRPERPCTDCGTTTTAASGVCPSCQVLSRHTDPSPDDELAGGTWVRRGLIHRWKPDREDAA